MSIRKAIASIVYLFDRLFPAHGIGGRGPEYDYSRWEYDVAKSILEEYPIVLKNMKEGLVLDVGCGPGGKSVAYAELSLFSSTYKNLIEPTLASDLTAQFINYPKSRIQGIETDFRWQMWKDRLSLHASATWMDPREVESNKALFYRPRFIYPEITGELF